MSDPVVVSYSRVKTRRRCHKLHHYKYILKLGRKKPAMSLWKGSLMHDMVEAYLLKKDWRKVLKEYTAKFNKLFKEEREELGDVPGNMERVMVGYINHWAGDGLKYLEVEKTKEVEIEKGLIFQFTKDGIVQDKKKRVWILERKTPKKFPDEDVRMSDLQTVLYTWAEAQCGRKTHGVLWDYVRSKPPTIPEPLKNGGLSVAQNIDTDYATYMAAIKKNKLNPKDYKEKLDSLVGNEVKFYRRVYMPVSDGVVKALVKDMKITAREIAEDPDSQVRTLSYDCDRCEFQPLCQAELRDLDTDFILKSQYEKSENDLNEEVEDE